MHLHLVHGKAEQQVLFCLHVVEKATTSNSLQGQLNPILHFNFDNFKRS